MFTTLTSSFTSIVKKIKFKDDEKSLKKACEELKKGLLRADVNHKVVKELIGNVESEVRLQGIGKENFTQSIKKNLENILTCEGNRGFTYSSKPPTVILMSGLQGSGKTTTTGKIANYLKLNGKKVLMVAADLQRVSAVEQLKQIGESIGVDVYAKDDAKNAVKLAKEALKDSDRKLYDVVLVDTAGRLAIDDVLMKELKEVKKAIKPFETFYVADSLSGNDAIKTAVTFNETIGIDGVILSKYDGDSKGGVALNVAYNTHVPLRFIGTGEKVEDFEQFLPERITKRLLGEGDLESLVEKTSMVIDEQKAKDMSKKIKKGSFSFNDFISQIEMISKMGNLGSMLSMVPGMSGMSDALKDKDIGNSREIKVIKTIVNSMTAKEREEPDLINGSRKARIAGGSGISVVEINRVLKQFKQASKMAKKISGPGGLKNMQNLMQNRNIMR